MPVTSALQRHRQKDQKFTNSRSSSAAFGLSQERKGGLKVFFDKGKLRESVVPRLAFK